MPAKCGGGTWGYADQGFCTFDLTVATPTALKPSRVATSTEFADAANLVLRELTKCKPYSEIFLQPVSRKDAPDYYDVITNPIDISTIRKRLKSGHYTTGAQFFDEFRLMYRNCREYNTDVIRCAEIITFCAEMERRTAEIAKSFPAWPPDAPPYDLNFTHTVPAAEPLMEPNIEWDRMAAEDEDASALNPQQPPLPPSLPAQPPMPAISQEIPAFEAPPALEGGPFSPDGGDGEPASPGRQPPAQAQQSLLSLTASMAANLRLVRARRARALENFTNNNGAGSGTPPPAPGSSPGGRKKSISTAQWRRIRKQLAVTGRSHTTDGAPVGSLSPPSAPAVLDRELGQQATAHHRPSGLGPEAMRPQAQGLAPQPPQGSGAAAMELDMDQVLDGGPGPAKPVRRKRTATVMAAPAVAPPALPPAVALSQQPHVAAAPDAAAASSPPEQHVTKKARSRKVRAPRAHKEPPLAAPQPQPQEPQPQPQPQPQPEPPGAAPSEATWESDIFSGWAPCAPEWMMAPMEGPTSLSPEEQAQVAAMPPEDRARSLAALEASLAACQQATGATETQCRTAQAWIERQHARNASLPAFMLPWVAPLAVDEYDRAAPFGEQAAFSRTPQSLATDDPLEPWAAAPEQERLATELLLTALPPFWGLSPPPPATTTTNINTAVPPPSDGPLSALPPPAEEAAAAVAAQPGAPPAEPSPLGGLGPEDLLLGPPHLWYRSPARLPPLPLATYKGWKAPQPRPLVAPAPNTLVSANVSRLARIHALHQRILEPAPAPVPARAPTPAVTSTPVLQPGDGDALIPPLPAFPGAEEPRPGEEGAAVPMQVEIEVTNEEAAASPLTGPEPSPAPAAAAPPAAPPAAVPLPDLVPAVPLPEDGCVLCGAQADQDTPLADGIVARQAMAKVVAQLAIHEGFRGSEAAPPQRAAVVISRGAADLGANPDLYFLHQAALRHEQQQQQQQQQQQPTDPITAFAQLAWTAAVPPPPLGPTGPLDPLGHTLRQSPACAPCACFACRPVVHRDLATALQPWGHSTVPLGWMEGTSYALLDFVLRRQGIAMGLRGLLRHVVGGGSALGVESRGGLLGYGQRLDRITDRIAGRLVRRSQRRPRADSADLEADDYRLLTGVFGDVDLDLLGLSALGMGRLRLPVELLTGERPPAADFPPEQPEAPESAPSDALAFMRPFRPLGPIVAGQHIALLRPMLTQRAAQAHSLLLPGSMPPDLPGALGDDMENVPILDEAVPTPLQPLPPTHAVSPPRRIHRRIAAHSRRGRGGRQAAAAPSTPTATAAGGSLPGAGRIVLDDDNDSASGPPSPDGAGASSGAESDRAPRGRRSHSRSPVPAPVPHTPAGGPWRPPSDLTPI
ncbi:putative transcriptional activator SPT7 [Paratrimastix pyriformis]|uniref:Transcriptional activator SPT7 n=1 Tax=Paratrimastix pyriformis TaxID=342808 RepID=A0ABQ8UW13_9EUKA|nr:putative transcriptional activator SPT7 [Paratrimastix pyriformis]